MTGFSTINSYAFRWADSSQRAVSKRQNYSAVWPAFVVSEIILILTLLTAYSFIANEKVRLETASRQVALAIPQMQESIDSFALTLAEKHSLSILERVAKELGYINPVAPLYLEL